MQCYLSSRNLWIIHVHARSEPLLPTQPEEIADLARAVSTPIALGERLYTRADFRPYLERRAVDIVQPDVRFFSFYISLYLLFTVFLSPYKLKLAHFD